MSLLTWNMRKWSMIKNYLAGAQQLYFYVRILCGKIHIAFGDFSQYIAKWKKARVKAVNVVPFFTWK